MTNGYQGFAISNLRTGFDEALEPWLLPGDAYQLVVNAHLYRGVLEKIDGYNPFAKFTNRNIIGMTQTPDGANKTFTVTLPSTPITSDFYGQGPLVVGTSVEEFVYLSDASSTLINLQGNKGGSGTVNLSTKVVTLIFNTAPPSSTYSHVLFEWDSAPAAKTAIMGIKPYYRKDGSQDVMVFDQKRVGLIESIFGILASNMGTDQAIIEIPHDYYQSAVFIGDGTMGPFTGTLQHPLVPGTVQFVGYTVTTGVPSTTTPLITDNGFGALIGKVTVANVTTTFATGFVDYVTGDYTITFVSNLPNTTYFDATVGIYGNLFTASISNFFSLVNYQYYAFFTDSIDPIFYYDGISIKYLLTILEVEPITSASGIPTNLDITKCLHVTVTQNRLLLLSPTVDLIFEGFSIYWSTIFQPLNFINGGNLPAPTSQSIRAFSFVNTDLVVRFANSERIFRYTGDAFSPFRWDTTNSIWACDAPYSPINYDSWFSSVGRPAIVGSDGVNVKRADEIIPDFTDPSRIDYQTPAPFMSQTSVGQCYGERFDDIKEGWLCYNSAPQDQAIPTASDNILAFNYLDETYAIYSFPFSCLGLGRRLSSGPTWAQEFTEWQDMADTWASYALQGNALLDLGGDQYDTVYELNSGNTLTYANDADTVPHPVLFNVISKNLNPFIEDGQLARLGYVDLFVTANITSILRVQFYVNDNLYVDSTGTPQGYYQESILTFTPTDSMSPVLDQIKVWKRIYVGAVAKTHTIRFYQNEADFGVTNNQPIMIHAMNWYAKPAGRIFN